MAAIIATIPKIKDKTADLSGKCLKSHENKIKGIANGIVADEIISCTENNLEENASNGKIARLDNSIPTI